MVQVSRNICPRTRHKDVCAVCVQRVRVRVCKVRRVCVRVRTPAMTHRTSDRLNGVEPQLFIRNRGSRAYTEEHA